MENKYKSTVEQMNKLKNQFVELGKAMREACKPISDFITGLASILKVDYKNFNDKKNKKNNKRLHRIKRNLMRRGTEDEKHIRRSK
jgi:citrate synthase